MGDRVLLDSSLALLFTLLILMSSGGNLLVCAAIFLDKKLRKQKDNLFLLSLALSDLMVSWLVMIFAAVNDLMGYWPFGTVYCTLWVSFDIMSCTASILNICAVAFDRYVHISDPLKYARWARKYRFFLAIVGIWILSATIGFLPQIFDFAQPALEEALSNRSLIDAQPSSSSSAKSYQCELRLQPAFAVISSLLSFYLPTTVMLIAYWKLYRCARRHVTSIKCQIRAVTESLLAQTARLSMPPCRQEAKRVENDVSDQKARVTLGVIISVFLICWFPFFCVNIVRAWAPHAVPQWLFQLVTWFGYANSTANPVIYSIFNREFRHAFRSILRSLCEPFCGLHKDNGKQPTVKMHRCSSTPDLLNERRQLIGRGRKCNSMIHLREEPDYGTSNGSYDSAALGLAKEADRLLVSFERGRSISANVIFTTDSRAQSPLSDLSEF